MIGGMAGRQLLKPVVGNMVRSVIERQGGPRVTSTGPPVPSSVYTDILMRAKEGDIAPGEADRQITKLGGRVRVNPLPKVPE